MLNISELYLSYRNSCWLCQFELERRGSEVERGKIKAAMECMKIENVRGESFLIELIKIVLFEKLYCVPVTQVIEIYVWINIKWLTI